MPSRSRIIPQLGKLFILVFLAVVSLRLVTVLTSRSGNRGGWNDYRSFAGYKDDKVNGAAIGGFSCTKIYYYIQG